MHKKKDISPARFARPFLLTKVPVAGYYLRTPNQTLYTVEFVADGVTYAIKTLHIEDLFEVLYLTGADATSGATPMAFTAPAK